MRIVHVITRLIVGGAQENTLLSCEGQHDLGHDVTLITGPSLGPEGSLMERATGYGYRVEVIDAMRRSILPVKDYQTYRQLVESYRRLQPDVVHTHSSKAGIVGRYAARATKVPAVIHTIHGLAFTASKSRWVNHAYRLMERRAAPLTDRIVCVADAMRDQSLAGGIGRAEQYVTVYSGMETEPFVHPPRPRQDVRRRFGLNDEHIVVGTIARLFHMKGHDDLLNLAPDLCRRLPNLRFLWVGDGLLRPEFERRIRQMKLEDRFCFSGSVPPHEVPNLTGAMDILVHPSRREGLARALPQGQLARCPVITYDVDGNHEGLIDGKTGILLPAFDVKALGEAIFELASSSDRRRTMGFAGREFALSRFGARVMVERLEEIYRSAISLEPSRRLVLKKLHDTFPDSADAGKALAVLDSYGRKSWHREMNRVHLALLKISGGDLEKLRLYTRGAQSDYRDTLVSAEFPEEWQAHSKIAPDELTEIRKRDRTQYESWLLS